MRRTGCTSRPRASESIPTGRHLGPEQVQPGDVVLLSGTMADHGMAVMLARGDLMLDADIRSDTAALGELVESVLEAAPSTRWMRDPTRGGVATVCNELARDTNLGVVLDETLAPHRPCRASAPAICWESTRSTSPTRARWSRWSHRTRPTQRSRRCARIRSALKATRIGEIVADPQAIVVLLTSFGGTRIVDMLVGDPLPRIC